MPTTASKFIASFSVPATSIHALSSSVVTITESPSLDSFELRGRILQTTEIPFSTSDPGSLGQRLLLVGWGDAGRESTNVLLLCALTTGGTPASASDCILVE
mmetsp:Transcript_19965/g.55406  ORF Transcript_19965/g.55406 Transcript_19965/m.55406 type:complete len:102 (-) Transcript_19965:7-312(-)